MGAGRASVVASPPRAESSESAWTQAEVERPPLAAGADAIFTQWDASRSPVTQETLVTGCVATPIPGWVEDMRPLVDARTVTLMNASAERALGIPFESRRDDSGQFWLRPVGTPADASSLGLARTFLGWDEGGVVTCFVICTSPKATRTRACDASVTTARLEGGATAPTAGVVLGAVTWGVHHPTTTVTWGGVLVFALGVVAVASRRRPRSRI